MAANSTMNTKRRCLATLFCLFLLVIFLAIPVSAANDKPTYEESVAAMDDYAYKVYLGIRGIVCPMAILSFASCGYKILGSIYFGNYASAAGTDAMKAQRQFVLTILAVVFVLAIPTIFTAARGIFEGSAWEPNAGP